MKFQERLEPLGRALCLVVPNCSHYKRPKDIKGSFLVWQEDGENSSYSGDNEKDGQAISGSIDYFTKTEFDTAIDEIQSCLNNIGVSWELNSVQYENETEYIHYEWLWEVV